MTDATLTAANPPPKPLLIYDGDCGFCRRWITRWQWTTGDHVDYLPFQDERVKAQFPELPVELFEKSVVFIEPDGRVSTGANAATRALATAPQKRWLLWCYEKIPFAAKISEACYRFVAKYRHFFSAVTRFFQGSDTEPPTYELSRSIFLTMLGAVYLIAFVSWWSQQSGLIGSGGILPASQLMENQRQWAAQQNLGWDRFRIVPTLCWLSASDGFLTFLCAGGTVMAALLMLGFAPIPMLIGLWIFYLSLATVGRDFMSFQWDNLLLETGFVAIFFARLNPLPLWLRNWWRKRKGKPRVRDVFPSRIALLLLWWLLFRLMFESGAVKLLPPHPQMEADKIWWSLRALHYHYETQPLPTMLAWYAHQLPGWFQKTSVFLMFVIELALPLFIFAPRRLRLFGCAGMILLMALIMLTGNYGFFNLLTIVLCLMLMDDATWRMIGRNTFGRFSSGNEADRWLTAGDTSWQRWLRRSGNVLRLAVAAVILTISITHFLGAPMFGPWLARRGVVIEWATPVTKLAEWTQPFRSINAYGLFRFMTRSRPELSVEGSDDGQVWTPYVFKYKAGDLQRPPRVNQPHQPRLDWQMWFEALHAERKQPPNAWFQMFCRRLLEGAPHVLALLEKNPFPERPPKYLRVMLYDYRFATPEAKRALNVWWQCELKAPYLPRPITLEDFDNPTARPTR